MGPDPEALDLRFGAFGAGRIPIALDRRNARNRLFRRGPDLQSQAGLSELLRFIHRRKQGLSQEIQVQRSQFYRWFSCYRRPAEQGKFN